MPISNCTDITFQGITTADGSSSATPPASDTITPDEPAEVLSQLYIYLVEYHIIYLFCSNKLMHRQELLALNRQVPMPPSQQSPRLIPSERPQQAPKPSRSGQKLYHLCYLSRHL